MGPGFFIFFQNPIPPTQGEGVFVKPGRMIFKKKIDFTEDNNIVLILTLDGVW